MVDEDVPYTYIVHQVAWNKKKVIKEERELDVSHPAFLPAYTNKGKACSYRV
jgi:hypothetical protein